MPFDNETKTKYWLIGHLGSMIYLLYWRSPEGNKVYLGVVEDCHNPYAQGLKSFRSISPSNCLLHSLGAFLTWLRVPSQLCFHWGRVCTERCCEQLLSSLAGSAVGRVQPSATANALCFSAELISLSRAKKRVESALRCLCMRLSCAMQAV